MEARGLSVQSRGDSWVEKPKLWTRTGIMNLPCIIPYIVLLTNPRFRNIWQSEEVWTSSIDITWLQWKPHVRTIWNACNPVSCFSLLASVLRSNNLVARYSIFLSTKIKKKKKKSCKSQHCQTMLACIAPDSYRMWLTAPPISSASLQILSIIFKVGCTPFVSII